jgi:D-glucosaminate-6-phosphate ammonia-lyase
MQGAQAGARVARAGLGPAKGWEMDIYERLGVRRWINAAGYMTRLGGSLMPDVVLDAMHEAAASFVDIAELQAAASRFIARHTGAEAGLVTSGAAAASVKAAAACMTGLDAAKMDRLPDTEGMANEIIMHRSHRYSYDHAIRAAGARVKDIGFDDRAAKTGFRRITFGHRKYEQTTSNSCWRTHVQR